MRIFSTIPSSACLHKCPGCYWQNNAGFHQRPDHFLDLEIYLDMIESVRSRFGHLMLNMNPGAESVKLVKRLFGIWSDIRLVSTTRFYKDNWINDQESRKIMDRCISWFDVSIDTIKIGLNDFDPQVFRQLPQERRNLTVLVYPDTDLYLVQYLLSYDLNKERMHITYPKGGLIENSSEEQLVFLEEAAKQGALPNAMFEGNQYGADNPEGRICDLPHYPFIDMNRLGEVRSCPYMEGYLFRASDANELNQGLQQTFDGKKYSIQCQAACAASEKRTMT